MHRDLSELDAITRGLRRIEQTLLVVAAAFFSTAVLVALTLARS